MKRGFISFLPIMLISALSLQGEPIHSQALISDQAVGDTSLHYVDDGLHPNASIVAAIIAGTYDSNYQRKASFIEEKFSKAAQRYERDWGALPQNSIPNGKILRVGDKGRRVLALNKRLRGYNSDVFDEILGDKISEYRSAHGLPVGRHADQKLITSLNFGFDHYQKKISINIHRASELPTDLGEKFILVNAASQQLHMYEGRDLTDSMRVIVGSPKNPTPMLAAMLRFSVVNPYWNIPPDLTRDRYAPRALKEGSNYLKARRFEALSGWDDDATILSYSEVNWKAVVSGEKKLRMRQRPGPGNGMGDIKFMFPNRFGVYLHDTHNEASFRTDKRAISAGCVRIEKPWVLAKWLYGEKPKADFSQPEQIVNLDDQVPVYITYFTAIPTENGFSFRDDIYGRDKRLLSVLNEQSS